LQSFFLNFLRKLRLLQIDFTILLLIRLRSYHIVDKLLIIDNYHSNIEGVSNSIRTITASNDMLTSTTLSIFLYVSNIFDVLYIYEKT